MKYKESWQNTKAHDFTCNWKWGWHYTQTAEKCQMTS